MERPESVILFRDYIHIDLVLYITVGKDLFLYDSYRRVYRWSGRSRMGADVEWKDFFHDNVRYADMINGVGCGGIQLVKGTDLQEIDPTEKKKSRDLLRRVGMGINFAIVGIENQEKVDYRFPLRMMHYDVTRYYKQASDIWKEIRKKGIKLTAEEYLSRFKRDSRMHPQVTFILYAGEEWWDGPVCLHDMLDFKDIPESLQKMVSNYKINIVDIRRFENTSVFKTDVKQVFDFIRCSVDKNKLVELVEGDTYYQHMEDDAYEVVSKYTNSTKLIRKEEYMEEGGTHNMCKAIRDLIDDSKAEGRAEGRAEERLERKEALLLTVKNLLLNGVSYEIVRASIMDLSDDELQAVYKEVCV